MPAFPVMRIALLPAAVFGVEEKWGGPSIYGRFPSSNVMVRPQDEIAQYIQSPYQQYVERPGEMRTDSLTLGGEFQPWDRHLDVQSLLQEQHMLRRQNFLRSSAAQRRQTIPVWSAQSREVRPETIDSGRLMQDAASSLDNQDQPQPQNEEKASVPEASKGPDRSILLQVGNAQDSNDRAQSHQEEVSKLQEEIKTLRDENEKLQQPHQSQSWACTLHKNAPGIAKIFIKDAESRCTEPSAASQKKQTHAISGDIDATVLLAQNSELHLQNTRLNRALSQHKLKARRSTMVYNVLLDVLYGIVVCGLVGLLWFANSSLAKPV